MTTYYLDPNGAGNSTQWTPSAGSNYQCVDDSVRSPTSPTSSGDGAQVTSSGAGTRIDRYTLESPTLDGTITAAKVWIYASETSIGSIRVNLSLSGTYLGEQVLLSGASAANWYSYEYTGLSGSLSSPVLEIKGVGIGGGNINTVYAAYVELTTTPAATAPEIHVYGNSVEITNGDNTPSEADYTDFGTCDVGNTISHTFRITNTGTDALDLTPGGGSPVQLGGTNADQWSVTTQASSPVAVDGYTEFVLRFEPTSGGTKSATVTIYHNGTNTTSPFTFSITGTAQEVLWCEGTIQHTTTVAGTHAVESFLTGTINHTTTVAGTHAVDSWLSGTVEHTTTVEGELDSPILLSGTIHHTTTVAGTVQVDSWLSGTINHTTTVAGDGAVYIRCFSDLVGQYRVEGTAAYDVWIGQDALPDLTDPPTATGATLPITSAVAANHTYYVVARQANAYGLSSQNVLATAVTVSAGGQVVAQPPSAPTNLALQAYTGGKVRVRGQYAFHSDGASQADKWAIRIRTNGTDPQVSDTPTLVAVNTVYAIAPLDYYTSAYADGADVRVLVRVRRTSDGVESTNSDILSLTADAQGPAFTLPPVAQGRTSFEQA